MAALTCPRTHMWLHGANTQKRIHVALFSYYRCDAVEVDLSYINGIVMLAHHVDDRGIDTTLQMFLDLLHDTRKVLKIKFDFKDRLSIDVGLAMIAHSDVSTRHSLVLSVDGLVGPGGGRGVVIPASVFASQVRSTIPGAEISIGMTTGWHIRTLFLSHGYSRRHVRDLHDLRNVTYALRLTVLAQTGQTQLSQLSANSHLLVWGQNGLFENSWLARHGDMCLDRDLSGTGWWVLGTYLWILSLAAGLCYLVYRLTRPPRDPDGIVEEPLLARRDLYSN